MHKASGLPCTGSPEAADGRLRPISIVAEDLNGVPKRSTFFGSQTARACPSLSKAKGYRNAVTPGTTIPPAFRTRCLEHALKRPSQCKYFHHRPQHIEDWRVGTDKRSQETPGAVKAKSAGSEPTQLQRGSRPPPRTRQSSQWPQAPHPVRRELPALSNKHRSD